MRRIDSEDVKYALFWTAVGLAATAGVGLLAHLGNAIVVGCAFDNQDKALTKAGSELNEKVGLAANLKGLEIASMELGEKDGKHMLKVFGSVKTETIPGLEENKYVNINFEISKNDAIKIAEQLSKLDSLKYLEDRGTVENNTTLVDMNKYNRGWEVFRFSATSNIKKAVKESTVLYNILEETIKNSKTHEIQDIFEASRMNNSISQIYRYMRPEVVGDTIVSGPFAHGHTTFINAGVMTTSISQVVKDETRGVSYFFIDTVQGREQDGQMVPISCRLRIEIDGTELSQEEVYEKFVKGEYSNYSEIVRNPDSSKLGVVGEELTDGVEEIELI